MLTPSFIDRRWAFTACFSALVAIGLGACSSSENGSDCRAEAASCRNDSECCTQNCVLQGTGGYCRAKGIKAVCSKGGEACTQNAHCCDGLCENDVCFGGVGNNVPTCQPNDAVCSRDDSCCSGSCGSTGTCLTVPTAARPDGGTCKSGGSGCVAGAECCSSVCFQSPSASGTICAGTSGNPGNTGGSCVASGRPCSSNFDCCSHSCSSRAGGSYCG